MSTSTGKQISRSASLAVRMVLVAVFTPTVALGLLAAVIVLLPSRYLVGLAVALLSDQSPTAVLSTCPAASRACV